MSISVDDVLKQTRDFITNTADKAVRERPSDNQIREVAEKEAATVSNRLHVDAKLRTNAFNAKFLLPHIETTAAWLRKASDHEDELTSAIESLGTNKLSEEIDSLNAKSSKEVERTKLRHREGDWGQIAKEKDRAEKNFEAMFNANDGKPPRKLPFWYWLILILIGSGEWLINFDTFASKFAVQAMAIGMTLLVAISFAAASHFHGEFIKQRPFLNSKKMSVPVKNSHLIFQLVSLVLFIVSFAAVILVRYQVVQDELSLGAGIMALPGESMVAQQSAFELVLPTIFLNLVVYLLGVVVSYVLHDPIPGYQTAKNDLTKALHDFEKIDNKLHLECEEIEARFHVDIEALVLKITDKEARASECKKELRRLRSRITTTKNSAVKRLISLSDDYRMQLITALRDSGKDDVRVGPNNLSIDDYAHADIDISGELFDEHV